MEDEEAKVMAKETIKETTEVTTKETTKETETNNISVKNLSKKFADFTLDQVSFQVPKGRIVGFIGENGAGKSTTIRLILNELKKDGGEIEIFGRD